MYAAALRSNCEIMRASMYFILLYNHIILSWARSWNDWGFCFLSGISTYTLPDRNIYLTDDDLYSRPKAGLGAETTHLHKPEASIFKGYSIKMDDVYKSSMRMLNHYRIFRKEIYLHDKDILLVTTT